MNTYQRSQVNTLRQRLAEAPHHIITLFGPRQTGKTTIVRQALRQIDLRSRYLAVDEPDTADFRIPSAGAETTFSIVARAQHRTGWCATGKKRGLRRNGRRANGFVLVFDEIQKIPQLVGNRQGLVGCRPCQELPPSRGYSGLGAATHAGGIE